MSTPAELRRVTTPPDLTKEEFSSRYFGAEMARPIIDHLATQVGRWETLETDAVYPRPQLSYEIRNKKEQENPFFAGIGFSPESEADFLDFFDAVWNFIQTNMDEMLSFAGENNTTILDKMLLKLIPQFELGLENNKVFKAFYGTEQVREQDGAVKKPYAHSLKVLRNVIRQNLFNALPDFTDDHPLRRFFPGNRHPVIFLSLFKAMTHDIGNLFFLDQDKIHFHALFSANVLYEYLVKRRGMPPLLAYSLAEDVDGHHIFEASAMHKVKGKDVTEQYVSNRNPDIFLALSILGMADVSTTKRIDLEIENLREQLMICYAEPEGILRQIHASMLIERINQLIDLINADDLLQASQDSNTPPEARISTQRAILLRNDMLVEKIESHLANNGGEFTPVNAVEYESPDLMPLGQMIANLLMFLVQHPARARQLARR